MDIYNSNTDVYDSVMYIHNSVTNIHTCIMREIVMDIHYLIMNVNN